MALGHALHAHRQGQRDRRQQPFRHVGDEETDEKHKRFEKRQPADEPAQKQKYQSQAAREGGDRVDCAAQLLLQRARFALDVLVRLAILPTSVFMPVPKTTARARPRSSEVPAKTIFGSSIHRNLPEIKTG